MIDRDPATQAQLDAMDPGNSTWLSANAGSGKTRVLTNRVAMLLLGGTKPQNIVCLTYTKAAASEMQNRLFQRLGAWAMMPDGKLAAELAGLGATGDLGPERLASARTLFAQAIETPGGLRIQTIHSFCASLLRRFPLEAGVSPMFRELDDRSSRELQASILGQMTEGPDAPLVAQISRIISGTDFEDVLRAIAGMRDKFDMTATREVIRGWFGLGDSSAYQMMWDRVMSPSRFGMLAQLRDVLLAHNTSTAQGFGAAIAALDLGQPGSITLDDLLPIFLKGDGTLRKQGIRPKSLETDYPELERQVVGFAEDLAGLRELRNTERAAQDTWTLYQFARRFLTLYESAKTEQGWLDFDDQISRTESLLSDKAVCQWVMFRLDGGIDHILVDEAQDTNPMQWRIIRLLAQDFGQEQEDGRERTIFAVGDKKQSIYSFQGADPLEFDHSRDHFSAQLMRVGMSLRDRTLRYSFRSSPAILALVDQVFQGLDTGGFSQDQHFSFHEQLPGRVDVWPIIPSPDTIPTLPWYDLSEPDLPVDAEQELAELIATEISDMISHARLTTSKGETRPVHAGDILILVQRRSALFHKIILACKKADLPIAGADRLRIGAELAVKDLRALLSFLSLPHDSLSLASALRSPLFGWSEKQLFDLAQPRTSDDLWPALVARRDDFPEPHAILTDLRNQSDFLTPYDLLDRILTRWSGRLKLLSRLGTEAEEGIDELLNLAREFEATNPASLTGFLAWLEKDDSDVKRQAEAAGSRIRVMTIHGAKGLEAPIVIMPQLHTPPENHQRPIVTDPDGRPIWRQNKDDAPDLQSRGSAETARKTEEERMRLLYVAMTRAESWLIFCGTGDKTGRPDTWYSRVTDALGSLGASPLETAKGPGLRLQTGAWPSDQDKDGDAPVDRPDHLPEWCLLPVPASRRAAQAIKPSEMLGQKTLDGNDESPFALQKGIAVHALLERPDWVHAPDSRTAALRLVTQLDIDLPEEEIDDAITQAGNVISAPEFAFLFENSTLSEVSVTAPVTFEGHDRMFGIIDRLVIRDDRVLIIDFKTNTQVPQSPGETPSGLLRQLAVYATAMAQIYPDRLVECAILWTVKPQLMAIPHNIVMESIAAPALS